MNDLTREAVDLEIEHVTKSLADLDPTSDEYYNAIKSGEILIKLANEDDRNQIDARIEELKLEATSTESKSKDKASFWGSVATVVGSFISMTATIAGTIIICVSNSRAQKRSIDFEKEGFSHTDRSDKFMPKVPFPR